MKAALLTAALALAAGTALAPTFPLGAHAANARNPYGNVNHKNDAGNDTGDSQVDQLNAAQLDQNYYRIHPQGGQMQPMGQPMTQGGPAMGGPAMGGPAMGGPGMGPGMGNGGPSR